MQVDFAILKQAVPIKKVMEMLQLQMKPERNQLRGKCPLCVSSNPRSFVVTPQKNLWFCHSCAQGGDQLKLVSLFRNCDIRAAAIAIAEHFGTVSTAPQRTVPTSPPAPNSGARRATGFDPEAYAARLDPSHENLKEVGVSPETLKEWRAGYASSGVMRGRLALPLHRGKEIVGYMGLGTDGTLIFPNGVNPSEFIFGMPREGELVLLRTPIAVLRAYEAGVNGCCFLTEQISPIQFEQLSALMTERGCDLAEIA